MAEWAQAAGWGPLAVLLAIVLIYLLLDFLASDVLRITLLVLFPGISLGLLRVWGG